MKFKYLKKIIFLINFQVTFANCHLLLDLALLTFEDITTTTKTTVVNCLSSVDATRMETISEHNMTVRLLV